MKQGWPDSSPLDSFSTLTFGDLTKEVNVFNLDKQPRKIRDQTFEVNFIENNCDEDSEGIENESLFLDKLFKNEGDYINEKTYVGDPNFRVPFKKRNFDLNIFTFDDISHENIIKEPPIDLTFENLFEEELMCLDESTRDILVNYIPPGKSFDLSFEEMYETELEFLGIYSKEVPTEKCDGDQFLNNGCRLIRKKNLRKVRLGRKSAKTTKRLTSILCPLKRTHWNDGKQARGMRPKKI